MPHNRRPSDERGKVEEEEEVRDLASKARIVLTKTHIQASPSFPWFHCCVDVKSLQLKSCIILHPVGLDTVPLHLSQATQVSYYLIIKLTNITYY